MVRRPAILVLAAALGIPAAAAPASARMIEHPSGSHAESAASPVRKPSPSVTAGVHTNVNTTVFWVGEDAGPDNGYISNSPSAWQDDWKGHFGGVDDPRHRSGYRPAGFTPKENPFYFALPYADYDSRGRLKKNVTRAPWYDPANPPKPGQSIIKNSWIKVTFKGRTAYAQWEDVGPYKEDDVRYVFGTARSQYRVGLDLSPAMSDYLGMGAGGKTTWQFVRPDQVPSGPWKEIVTTSGIDWR